MCIHDALQNSDGSVYRPEPSYEKLFFEESDDSGKASLNYIDRQLTNVRPPELASFELPIQTHQNARVLAGDIDFVQDGY